MKIKRSLTCGILAALAPMAVWAQARAPESEEARHVINLNNVELTALIEDVSAVTGYTFIVHPNVRTAKVTVTSQQPMSPGDVFQVFLSTLRVHGFTAIPAGRNTYRVIPEEAAGGEARLDPAGPNSFATAVIKFDHFNALKAAQIIKPLVDSQGQVVAISGSNSLVVVDYASNLARLRLIADELDEDVTTVRTVAMRNVPATEMATILTDLLGRREDGSAATDFQVSASATSNSIVVRGDELTVGKAIEVAGQVDQSDPVRDSLRVISLNNADADEIVPILEKLAATMAAQRSLGEETAPQATIAHHPQTNSLIISAEPETQLAMERVVEVLDQRRAQVLVEAIIVEMSDDTARQLGVQFLLSGTGNSSTPFASTNFSRSAPNLLALAGALVGDGLFDAGAGNSAVSNPFRAAAVNSLLNVSGLNLGLGGQDGDTLFGAILTAVEADTASRVLSKPFNMTLDNGKSSLIIGQDVPVTRGEVLGDANTNPFRTVDRKEIGVKLEVTPRISSDDTIRLEITQEVSSIFDVVSSSGDFILNTRQIETSVLADNGEIIVLGGLIEQADTQTDSKVPFLGDIPILGNLFKSSGKDSVRRNLMVFIKPTIVRSRDDARAVTSRNYRHLRAEELLRTKADVSEIDVFFEQVLGAVPRVE